MKKVKIVKTAEGYVLRQSIRHTLLKGICSAMILGLSIFTFSMPWWVKDGQLAFKLPGIFWCVVGLGGMALGVYAFWLTVGTKLVFDPKGVRFYRLFCRVSALTWREIKSWGVMDVSTVSYHYRRAEERYEFFVSSDRKNAADGKRISIELSPRESVNILQSELMDFCVDRIPQKAKRVGTSIGGRELVNRKTDE